MEQFYDGIMKYKIIEVYKEFVEWIYEVGFLECEYDLWQEIKNFTLDELYIFWLKNIKNK